MHPLRRMSQILTFVSSDPEAKNSPEKGPRGFRQLKGGRTTVRLAHLRAMKAANKREQAHARETSSLASG